MSEASDAVVVSRRADVGMVTLRGDLSSSSLRDALRDCTGCAVPDMRRIVFGDAGAASAWMSPDELLLMGPRAVATHWPARFDEGLGKAHYLAADVSDARVAFRIAGAHGRDALAKGAPVDLSAAAFGPGDFRRTRLGQVACAFWMPDPATFDLVCFRSVADFVGLWLDNAAAGPFPQAFAAAPTS